MTKTNIKKEIKKWVVEYDEETDILYISRPIIPADAMLFGINNGYACYITKKNKIVGIMIEYFTTETLDMKKKLNPKD